MTFFLINMEERNYFKPPSISRNTRIEHDNLVAIPKKLQKHLSKYFKL